MKRLLVFLMFIVLPCTLLLGQRVDDSLRYAESIWAMQKKAVILEEMKLSEAEKSSFWPVYESYANAVQYLDMEYIRLLSLTEQERSNKKSDLLTEHLLTNDLLLAKTRKLYFRKFKKALTPAQAGKFMQLDSDFRIMLRLQAQKESPALVTSATKIYSLN